MPQQLSSLINTLKLTATNEQLADEMDKVKEWHTLFGKTEMGRWVQVLDRCDDILECACVIRDFSLEVDRNVSVKKMVISALRFSALVFENTSSRSIYASTDRLIALMDCSDMEVLVEVLRFLLVVSKRSRFLSSRLGRDLQKKLVERLVAIAECWGGKVRQMKLEDCVRQDLLLPAPLFPFPFTNSGHTLHVPCPQESEPLLAAVDAAVNRCEGSEADRVTLIARIRLARHFDQQLHRMNSMIARLLAMSTLLYSHCGVEEQAAVPVLPPDFIKETSTILHLDSSIHPLIDTLKAEALRTLTSIISNDKPQRLTTIMESLSANTYHGFLGTFTRRCVDELKAGKIGSDGCASVSLCTALFSLLYHMSSMDTGARHARAPSPESLVGCGLTETLLSVVSTHCLPTQHISFATRCVRVIDILSSMDVQGFLFHKGIDVCVDRLVYEVEECRREQPFVIDVSEDKEGVAPQLVRPPPTHSLNCQHQRAALIKSLLNFLKRIINETHFGEGFRRSMEGALPEALIHIISNVEYYSASLFFNALQLVSNFVYQEPSQLTHLQQKHLPFVVLQSLLRKEIPSSREIINSMAGIFTALCLNERGLAQFKLYHPFDDFFRIMLSTKFIYAMKKKRNDMNDSAMGIAQSLEELLRNHASLRQLILDSISNTLSRLVQLGKEAPPSGTRIVMSLQKGSNQQTAAGLSPSREESVLSPREEDADSDDEDTEAAEGESPPGGTLGLEMDAAAEGGRMLPLGDYLLIFGRLIDYIIVQPQTADMVEGFLARECIPLLLQTTRLPNLRAELAQSNYPQIVASIVKHILQHSQKEEVLRQLIGWTTDALTPMAAVMGGEGVSPRGASLLAPLGLPHLVEMLTNINSTTIALANLTRNAVNGHVREADVRNKVLSMWAEDGQQLHALLHRVYGVLTWENCVITRMKASLKVSAHTQTEEVGEEGGEEDGGEGKVGTAVEAEAVQGRRAPEEDGISQEETTFWLKNKELLRQVSKAYRNVTELLVLLGRLCVGNSTRSRRQFEPQPYSLSKSAAKLAGLIFLEYTRDIFWKPSWLHKRHPLVCAYLSDLVQHLSCLLFDERRSSYHHLLHRFYSTGCYSAFLGVLTNFAVPSLQEECLGPSMEHLLSEWFKLAARLVNKTGILSTRHKMTEPTATKFPINKFYTLVQMNIHGCLMSLLPLLKSESSTLIKNNKMMEMIFTLLKEVTRNVLWLHDEGGSEGAAVEAAAAEPVDNNNLQRLLDMGFEQEAAVQALITFRNVSEAAEYLVNDFRNQPRVLHRMMVLDGNGPLHMRVALPINNPPPIAPVAVDAASPADPQPESSTDSVRGILVEDLSDKAVSLEWDEVVSLSCKEWIPLAISLMDGPMQQSVFDAADLTLAVVHHAPEEWKKTELLGGYMREEVIRRITSLRMTTKEDSSRHLGALLHFVCLVFEGSPVDYLEVLSENPLVPVMLDLLNFVNYNFELDYLNSNVLSQLLLWFDLLEKCTRHTRRVALYKDKVDALNWFYYPLDERYGARGKWVPYSEEASKHITKCFLAGHSQCKVRLTRRDCTIDLVEMMQRPESSPDKHHVIPMLPESLCSKLEIEKILEEEEEPVMSPSQQSTLMNNLTSLLAKSRIVGHGAHCALSLSARLTRDSTQAAQFVQEGGISSLLSLRAPSSTNSALLFSLCLRHCLEDSALLGQQYEKALRGLLHGTLPAAMRTVLRVSQNKDWMSVLALYSLTASRSPRQYAETLGRIAKMEKNGQMSLTPPNNAHATPSTEHAQQILELLLKEVLSGDWTHEENKRSPSTNVRMFSRWTLLSTVAELVKSYSCAAQIVAEMKTEQGQSVLGRLIDKYFDPTIEKDTTAALQSLLCCLAGSAHSPRAQEAVVSEMRTCLVGLLQAPEPVINMHLKVSEMAFALSAMMNACPLSQQSATPAVPRHVHSFNSNAIVRLVVKKRLLNELMRCVTQLSLSKRESVEAANQVIRTIEEMSKVINYAVHQQVNGPEQGGRRLTAEGGRAVELGEHLRRFANDDTGEALFADVVRAAEMEAARNEERLDRLQQEMAEGAEERLEEEEEERSVTMSESSGEDGEVEDERDGEEEDGVEDEDEAEDEEEEREGEEDYEEMDGMPGHLADDSMREDSLSSGADHGEEHVELEEVAAAAVDGGNEVMVAAVPGREEEEDSEVEEEEDFPQYDDEETHHVPPNMDVLHRIFFDINNDDVRMMDGFVDIMEPPHSRWWRMEDVAPRLIYRDGFEFARPLDGLAAVGGGAQQSNPAHPLMQRPAASAIWSENSRSPTPRMTGPTSYRIIARRGNVGLPLQRQNAVRRPPFGMMAGNDAFMERLLERGLPGDRRRPHVFSLLAGGELQAEDGVCVERERRPPSPVPVGMERMLAGARVLDEQSATLIACILNSILYYAAKEKEKQETAAAEAVKKEKKKADEAAAASSRVETAEEKPTEAVQQGPAQALPTVNAQEQVETEGVAAEVSVEEVHAPQAVLEVEVEAADEVPAVAGQAAAPRTPPGTPAEAAATGGEAAPAVAIEPQDREAEQQLGDSEIPEGVDPAFLAALPEEMRAEVLRDHERQQRAARMAQQRAAPAPAAPGVEPIDPEFLNALPPELQEEILAQHERQVRQQHAAAQAAVAEPAEDNPAAVIQSLPPSLRAQVLADADDTVLQVLPPDLAEEARRLRNERGGHHHQVERFYQRLAVHARGGRHGRAGGAVALAATAVGHAAGSATTAPSNGIQVLDKEAFSALVLLLFMDNRFAHNRLQRTLRTMCMHKASCDYLIYALLAILEKASSPSEEEDLPETTPSWIDSITVSGVGHNERVLKIAKNGSVFVHPLTSSRVAANALELLVGISKTFPGAFVPQAVRKDKTVADNAQPAPPPSHFWNTLLNFTPRPSTSKDAVCEHVVSSLDESPLSRVINFLRLPSVLANSQLIDRIMKLLSQVMASLPDDTLCLLGADEWSVSPLSEDLGLVISVITSGCCSADALNDGRVFLVEAMRAMKFRTTARVYGLLLERAAELGGQLRPQIERLRVELEGVPEGTGPGPSRATDERKPASNRSRNEEEMERWREALEAVRGEGHGPRAFASSCAELQLPSMMGLVEKKGVQHAFLSALHTICKVRDSLNDLKEVRKKRAMEDATRKYEAAKKEFEEKAAKKEEEANADKAETNEGREEATTSSAETKVEPPKVDDFVVEDIIVIPELRISERLQEVEELWPELSCCLLRLGRAADPHAVLALQPAAEAFFLVHAVKPEKAKEVQEGGAPVDDDARKLLHFAEKHRAVLNQVLRTSSSSLSDGPFAALSLFPKLLDFDVKRKHFRKELNKMDDRLRYRRDDVAVRVRRSQLFSDSFRELFRLRGTDWKSRFYIMFDGEEGQDAGGLLREWFSVITREIFNPNYALFITAPGDRVTYMINKASYINPEHLDYFKFVGRIIAKAVHDNKLLDCYFTRAFYKHILSVPVRYQDMESEDPSFYKSLEFLLNNPIETLGTDLTFTLEVEEFGVRQVRPLKENGANICVTDENKEEYVRLVCQMKMTGSIRRQLDAFLDGFYEVIPKHLIAMFNEQELELLISGLPNVDIDDLMTNTEYRSYSKNSVQIQWFWRALHSFAQEDRAKFLQFVTGTSKVPLNGFASLEGMNGVQKFSIHMDSRGGHRLPAAHTCFNQLDLPQYESYEKLRECLLLAIRECTEGFGFA